MIIGIFIKILAFVLGIMAVILPTWKVWPDEITNGFSFFVSTISDFNFILPIDTFLTAVVFLVNFIGFILIVKLIKIILKR